jgi:predicted regulator of Ras-like GTPase activity (Roadblock/LC7/MglB family)
MYENISAILDTGLPQVLGVCMFKQKLTRVVNNIDGAVGCMLIGFDGIAIDSVFRDQEIPQLSAIAVELSNMLDKFRRLQVYDVGDVNEVSITTGSITTLARVVADEYLLVLALDRDADVGRGQTMLRLISPFVEREMV